MKKGSIDGARREGERRVRGGDGSVCARARVCVCARVCACVCALRVFCVVCVRAGECVSLSMSASRSVGE